MVSKATIEKAKNMSRNQKAQPFSAGITIKCTCGAEILMLPNIKLMASAIEKHVALHKQKIKDKAEAELEAERVRDFLNKQVLKKASQA